MNEIFQRDRDRTIAIEKGGNKKEMMKFDYLHPKKYNMLVYLMSHVNMKGGIRIEYSGR